MALRADAADASVRADWDDADAAVYGGLSRLVVAVTRIVPVSPDQRQYQLRCMSGEDGLLVIDRPAGAPDDPLQLRVRCSIGRLGDPELERAVVEGVTRRLHELCGVEYAPLK